MAQHEEGLAGRLVSRMIRRSLRSRLEGIYWRGAPKLQAPVIFACTHHGWLDGYVIFEVASRLGLPILCWIEEFDAFPLFRSIGGMPFPVGNRAVRAQTIRQTVRLMNQESRSLLLFPEGVLHYGPEILPFGRTLDFLAEQVPASTVVPVAIRYEAAMHERPEAFVSFGNPIPKGLDLGERAREALAETVDELTTAIRTQRPTFELIMRGTSDVNQRWDMRNIPGFGRR